MFSASHQQKVFGQSPGSRAANCTAVAPQDKCHQQMSPGFLLHLGFYAWADVLWYGIPLCSGSAGPALVPPKTLPSPQPTLAVAGGSAGKAQPRCLAQQKPNPCWIGNTQLHLCKTQHYKRCSGGKQFQLSQTQCKAACISNFPPFAA